MAYKGMNWVEAYSYIGSYERAAHISWAVFVGRSWDGPNMFLLLSSSIVVSPPLSHRPLFAVQYT
jgi:hypothetical protein